MPDSFEFFRLFIHPWPYLSLLYFTQRNLVMTLMGQSNTQNTLYIIHVMFQQDIPWVDVGFAAFEVVVKIVAEQVNQVYCVVSCVRLI